MNQIWLVSQLFPKLSLLITFQIRFTGLVVSFVVIFNDCFFVWVFFHEHSRFTAQLGKGETNSLTPLYQFYPLHRNIDISRAITAESSRLHKAGSRS